MLKIKTSLLLFLVFLLGSCFEVNNPTQTLVYGLREGETENIKKVEIELECYQNFDSLYFRLDQIVCSDSLAFISFPSKNGHKKRIRLSNYCTKKIVCLLIKEFNVLWIEDEEILLRPDYDLSNLENLIYKHYCNFGALSMFSREPEEAMIYISYENKDITNMTEILDRITDAYSSLYLDIPLILYIKSPIPPPPPPFISKLKY